MSQISSGRDNLIANLTQSPTDLLYYRRHGARQTNKRPFHVLVFGSSMNLFQTLLHPDREELEMGERMVVSSAANLLQVGEFQFLQLAYREWFDKDLPEALVARLFSSYMLHDEVPHWARHYARVILSREERGQLDENDPGFHRYDHDYHTFVPQGVRRFCTAVGLLTAFMATALLVASMTADKPTSLLPPYFSEKELRPVDQDPGFGRADQPTGSGRP